MFDFRLQVFHKVAKRLNFTKAAEELNLLMWTAVLPVVHAIPMPWLTAPDRRDAWPAAS